MRDQHVEFAAWIQHADPGFRQPGDRPITRLPNNDAELRRYDALLLVDPDLRALGAQWPEMITNFVGQEGGGLIFVAGELYSQQLFESADSKAPGGDWTRILPVVREPGLYPHRGRGPAQLAEHLHPRADARGPRRPDLRVPPRPDPQPRDPDQPARHVLELPRHPRPPRRDRPGPARRPADAEPVRPARAAGLAALRARPDGRSSASTAPTAGAISPKITSTASGPAWSIASAGTRRSGGRFPFQVHLGKGVYRVGDRVSIGVRYTDPAALAEAAELTAELEIAGQPPEPLRFEKVPDDPGTARRRPSRPSRPAPIRSGSSRRRRPTWARRPGLDHDVPRRAAPGARSTSPRSTGRS